MEIIELKNVSFSDEGKNILEDINLSVKEGEVLSIIGHSGSGKSTLLKAIGSFISASKGEITYKGEKQEDYDPKEYRKEVAYIFQSPYLFGDTVLDNFKFPYKVRGLEINKNRMIELLEKFNMDENVLNKDISVLSGGEKQRIALIRSLLFSPKVLLLDEVTSSLDEENKEIVEKAVERLNKEGITMIMVTHDVDQANRLGNRILTLTSGKIEKIEEA